MRIVAGFVAALLVLIAWDLINPIPGSTTSTLMILDDVANYFALFIATVIGGFIAQRNFVTIAVLIEVGLWAVAVYILQQITLEPYLDIAVGIWWRFLIGVVTAALGAIVGQRYYNYRQQSGERSNIPLEGDG